MNWSRYFLVALALLVSGPHIIRAQLPAARNRGLNPPALIGSVESAGGRFYASLANTDATREFRGTARISIGSSDQQSETAKIEFTLAPQESRLFPLDSRGVSGNRYTLAVYDQAGSLIILKNAPVKSVTDISLIAPPPTPAAPTPAAAELSGAKGVTVKARLVAGRSSKPQSGEIKAPAAEQPSQAQIAEIEAQVAEQLSQPTVATLKVLSGKLSRRRQGAEIKAPAAERPSQPQGGEIEAPVSDETGPAALSFEITAPSPIINATLSVSAKGFAERQAVTVRSSASVEFKLPDDFNEPKINYTLTDATGRALTTGELKLEELRMEDSVSVTDVNLNRLSYTPGESAHITMTLEGRSPHGYRLEVTAKNEDEAILLRDSRTGVYHQGRSIQEFRIEIPSEAKGAITLEFKVFGNLTKKLFASGAREIPVIEAQDKEISIDNRSLL